MNMRGVKGKGEYKRSIGERRIKEEYRGEENIRRV